MDLLNTIKRLNRQFELALSEKEVTSVFHICKRAGYEEALEEKEETDIAEIVADYKEKQGYNPLGVSSHVTGKSLIESNTCPVCHENMKLVFLSNNTEACYCEKHYIALPLIGA